MSDDKPSDRAAAIRTWLMRAPRPESLRIYGKSGKEYDCEIRKGTAWSETAISVASLEPEKIEALSADGSLLRACVVNDLVAKEERAEVAKQSTFAAMTATDPETQRMIVFAELLARSSDRALEFAERTVVVAFTKLQEFADSLAQQATASTQSANDLSVGIRNLMVQQAQEAAADITEKEESPLEKLAANFMAGQAMAEAGGGVPVAAAAAKPNGKH